MRVMREAQTIASAATNAHRVRAAVRSGGWRVEQACGATGRKSGAAQQPGIWICPVRCGVASASPRQVPRPQ